MFVGHFGVGTLLVRAFPSVSPLYAYGGVSFPDLLWGVLAGTGIERVRVDPASALQERVEFQHYPYSHSLVLANLIACLPAAAIVLASGRALPAVVFLLGSVSHWLLDVVVHRRDLPVLGFGRWDVRVGWGLWLHPRLAFGVEYLVYAVPTALVTHGGTLVALLVVGALFHLANANSFFGWTRANPTPTRVSYALTALAGFVGMSLVLARIA